MFWTLKLLLGVNPIGTCGGATLGPLLIIFVIVEILLLIIKDSAIVPVEAEPY